MATKPASVSSSSGLIALTTVVVALIVGYAYYLVDVGRALDFQAEMLGPSRYLVKPAFIIKLISQGGFIGTATAVALKVVHAMLIAAVVYFLATVVISLVLKPKTKEEAIKQSELSSDGLRQQVFDAGIEGSEMVISIPDTVDPVTGERIAGIFDANPYQQSFFRLDSKPVVLSREPSSPVEELQHQILEILAAHSELPASVGNHHADATLRAHSLDVAKKVKAVMARQGRQDPLGTLIGLSHDLDKLLAYQKKGDTWVKNNKATHHNTYSAYIVSNLPAFKNLDKDDQNALVLVLRYYHHPAQLPLNSGVRVEHLIQAIREADGWGIRDEKMSGIASARENPEISSLLSDALTQFLADADINRYKGGTHADGWTVNAVEYVIVPASTILERLHNYLPGKLSKQLQLNVETRIFGHPAIEVIREALIEMGLLMEEFKEISSPTGLFDVKVGQKRFSACFLLNKAVLQNMMPSMVHKWGMTNYGLRVRGATHVGLDDSDDDHE